MGARPSFASDALSGIHTHSATRGLAPNRCKVWCVKTADPTVPPATIGLVPIRRNRFGVLIRQTPHARQRRSRLAPNGRRFGILKAKHTRNLPQYAKPESVRDKLRALLAASVRSEDLVQAGERIRSIVHDCGRQAARNRLPPLPLRWPSLQSQTQSPRIAGGITPGRAVLQRCIELWRPGDRMLSAPHSQSHPLWWTPFVGRFDRVFKIVPCDAG